MRLVEDSKTSKQNLPEDKIKKQKIMLHLSIYFLMLSVKQTAAGLAFSLTSCMVFFYSFCLSSSHTLSLSNHLS